MKNFILSFLVGYYARSIQKSWFGQAVRTGLIKSISKEFPDLAAVKTRKPYIPSDHSSSQN